MNTDKFIGALLTFKNYVQEIYRAQTLNDKLAAFDKAEDYADKNGLEDKKIYEAFYDDVWGSARVVAAREVFCLARKEETENSDAGMTFQRKRFARLLSCFRLQLLAFPVLRDDSFGWLSSETRKATRWLLDRLNEEAGKAGADPKTEKLLREAERIARKAEELSDESRAYFESIPGYRIRTGGSELVDVTDYDPDEVIDALIAAERVEPKERARYDEDPARYFDSRNAEDDLRVAYQFIEAAAIKRGGDPDSVVLRAYPYKELERLGVIKEEEDRAEDWELDDEEYEKFETLLRRRPFVEETFYLCYTRRFIVVGHEQPTSAAPA